jgi:hypothetical protein
MSLTTFIQNPKFLPELTETENTVDVPLVMTEGLPEHDAGGEESLKVDLGENESDDSEMAYVPLPVSNNGSKRVREDDPVHRCESSSKKTRVVRFS